MNNDLLFLIKKQTDTLIEQTKTKPQENLEKKLKRQMENFSFKPPINVSDEVKWFLAVKNFEATISVSDITDDYNSFSIPTPSQ